ncbi:MAG: hypothetical protein JXP34_17780, partial [Planctomycetes bacterium]|nr:hypothetical protein [Planctomycetota bacterium]
GGSPIAGVRLAIDGRAVDTVYSSPYELAVPWDRVGAGEHALAVTAFDRAGNERTVRRSISVSEYFALSPEDGAVVSGDDVRASWRGSRFGATRIRYRLQGTEAWSEIAGENARERAVVLAGLEPGKVYEWQPIGDGEPGPVRTVTRVKGLAFGEPRYGAVIERDYGQRVGISVRNHGEAPRTVRLTCGSPPESELLVGFVGEGSEGAPFVLAPGEEKEFWLGLSAQNVKRPEHRFPVRIASDDGVSDEAEVSIRVKLPEVKLRWEDRGAAGFGLGRAFRLVNQGDTLTDLQIRATGEDVSVSPSVEHGMLRRGASLDVTVYPKLDESFRSASTDLSAAAFGTEVTQPVEIAVEEGKRIFGVHLLPGEDIFAIARAMGGAFLNPNAVDLSRRDRPEDTDGDGRADRWAIDDPAERTRWTVLDTDGDGEVDMAHADVGRDGQQDFAAFKTEEGWEETNIIEAYLEMGFRLPWARDAYEKHDVDIAVNGRVVGRLRDTIPEGNYCFPIPPSILRFNAEGFPDSNDIDIRSTHIRGGHYVVSSDFRVRARTIGAKVFTAAATAEEARRQVFAAGDLVVDEPNYSVSSAELRIEGPERLQKGAKVEIVAPIRNLGAVRTRQVTVALVRCAPGGRGVELARETIEAPPLHGTAVVRLPWSVAAGNHTLKVAIDPDRVLGDADASNDEAIATLQVPGDDQKPALELKGLADGATLEEPVFALEAIASDDSGLAKVEASIDGGLWQPLRAVADGAPDAAATYRARGLLQPGSHAITVRATDSGGNAVERRVTVKAAGTPPAVEIVEPKTGAALASRIAGIVAKVPADAVAVGVRVNGGPWQAAERAEGGLARARVECPFGDVRIEVRAVDPHGRCGTAAHAARNPNQPAEGDAARGAGGDSPPRPIPVDVPGLGPVDVFSTPDAILPDDPAPDPRREPASAGTSAATAAAD